MKKIYSVIALSCLLPVAAAAQTMSDALTFGTSNYYGTARTMGMGNAVTAVGGDIGTIGINPAGGAVSSFSQFSFSGGFLTASSQSSFAPSYSVGADPVYAGAFKDSRTRAMMPNIGVNIVFESMSDSFRSWNLGMIVNRSQTFTSILSASGLEGKSSITGAFATSVGNMPGDVIGDYDGMWDRGYYWNPLSAYAGGLINYDATAQEFYGSAETKYIDPATGKNAYEVRGTLRQNIGNTTIGSRNDFILNNGFNFNDRFFLGINLTIPMATYNYSEFYSETAQDPSEFTVTPEYWKNGSYIVGAATNYKEGVYKYSYNAELSGIGAKIGVIWLPTAGLRLGAAITTPTDYTINERWYVESQSSFTNSNYDAQAISPDAQSTYEFISPYSANFGVAYTFGRYGMLSVDYELTDYSHMRFREYNNGYTYSYNDPFYYVNRLNSLFCGVSHSLRVGAEVRVLPSFSLRAGFNLTTDPQRYYNDTDNNMVYASDYDMYFDDYEMGKYQLVKSSAKYIGDKTTSVSFGAGYTSRGPFFADLAFRFTEMPARYYQAYGDYLADLGSYSPIVKSDPKLFDAVLTLGWRF